MNNNNELIHGLKVNIIKQVDLKHQEHKSALINSKYMIDAWKSLYEVSIYTTKNKEAIRNNLKETIMHYAIDTNLHILTQSSNFNIYTKISNYTNKKGIVSSSHFTRYGSYIGSVKKLGDKPINYKGWFPIQEFHDKIEIDFNILANLKSINNEYPLNNIFIVKQELLVEPEDIEFEIELTKPKPKPKTKKIIKKIPVVLEIVDDEIEIM